MKNVLGSTCSPFDSELDVVEIKKLSKKASERKSSKISLENSQNPPPQDPLEPLKPKEVPITQSFVMKKIRTLSKNFGSEIVAVILSFLTLQETIQCSRVSKTWYLGYNESVHWSFKFKKLINTSIYRPTDGSFLYKKLNVNLKEEYIKRKKIVEFELNQIPGIQQILEVYPLLEDKKFMNLKQQIFTNFDIYFVGKRFQLCAFEYCFISHQGKYYQIPNDFTTKAVGLSKEEFDIFPLIDEELRTLISLKLTNRKVFSIVIYILNCLLNKSKEILNIGNITCMESKEIFKVDAESQDENEKMKLLVTKDGWEFQASH